MIEAEEGAVSTYRELIDVAETAGDPVTEDPATELLADEEEHLTEFEGYRQYTRTDGQPAIPRFAVGAYGRAPCGHRFTGAY